MPSLLSRRSLLSRGAALGLSTVLGGILGLFPEANQAVASGRRRLPGFLNTPDDLVLGVVEGPRRNTLIQGALQDLEARQLLLAVPDLQAVLTEARVTEATWRRGTEEALIVAVPLSGTGAARAALFHSLSGGRTSSWLVEFPDASDLTVAKVYSIEAGAVRAINGNGRIVIASNTCTTDCIIRVLGLYGCSGLAGVLCAAAILGCGVLFNPLSCIGAVACTLYCGGAFAKSTCYCCGLSC